MKPLLLIVTVLATALACAAQDVTSGVVVDSRGAPVVGARVICDGGLEGSTDADGRFAIAPCDGRKVTVSAAGFRTLTVSPNGTPIVLEPAALSATVNVTRADTRVVDAPSSVVSVGRSDMQNSGSLTLDDRLRQVPGFTLFRRAGSSTANPTAQGVSLRGVGASGASRALVLDDGVPLNDPFGGWIYWGRVPSGSIASVELIRGSASDLYGSSAVGGVISIVERSTQAVPFADLDLAYGSQRSPYGSFFGGLGTEKFRTSLGAEAYRTDGFIPTAPEARGPVDTLANVGRYSLRPRLEYRPRASISTFAASGLYQERRRNGSRLQNNDTRIGDAKLGTDVTTKHSGTFSARLYGVTGKYHQSFSAIAANRQSETPNRLQTVPSQALGANLQWTRAFGSNVLFLGSDIRQVRGRSDEVAIANGAATSLTSAGGRETTFGAFAGVIVPLKKVTLSGGVRYDRWWNTRGYSATRALATDTGSITHFADRSESRLSPRVSALVRVSRHISFSGVFSSAFRQPTLNELYRSFRVGNVLTLANAALTAERAFTAETAGIVSALDDRFYLRAGPFCTWINNTVSNVTLSATPSLITRQRQNLGSTRSCGLEADLRVVPRAALSISAGYLFVDSVVASMPGNSQLLGLTLPQVARHQLTVDVRYSPRNIGTFAAQFRTSSSQWDDDLNTLRLAPYAALDVFVSRDVTQRVNLYFATENITNERVESGRTPVLTLARPRTARIGIRLRFGKN